MKKIYLLIYNDNNHQTQYTAIYKDNKLNCAGYFNSIGIPDFLDIFEKKVDFKCRYLTKKEMEIVIEKSKDSVINFPLHLKNLKKWLKDCEEEKKPQISRFELMDI